MRSSRFDFAHALFGKPVPTPDQVRGGLFPEHALAPAMPEKSYLFKFERRTLHLCEIPQLERLVRAARQCHAAVRREGNRVDPIRMPGKAEKGVARCNVPKREGVVLT